MKWRALKTAVLLSLLFVVVYGACNWISALRGYAGRFYFEWERGIPFVAWMIVPYMMIDLFFVAAPFICRSERALRTFAARVGLAIFVAAICFLLLPMQFAFERPAVGGWLGALFDRFRQADLPFNEFPSLHIALAIILAGVYGGRAGRIGKWAVYAMFVVIGASTVFVYQHHVIDVVGGVVLAAICLQVVREGRPAAAGNARVGGYYAGGALVLVGIGMALGRWGWVLIWPAMALVIAAAGYFFLGVGIYGKRSGRLPWATRVLLWPVLAGQWLSLRYYARRSRAWDVLTERVWIGRQLNAREAREAVSGEGGVRAVVDLTGEFSEPASFVQAPEGYLALPVLDLTAPTQEQLRHAAEWIEHRTAQGIVYVHCKVGYSRTAAVAGAYLLAKGRAASAHEAMEMLRAARRGIIIRREVREALAAFSQALGDSDARAADDGRACRQTAIGLQPEVRRGVVF